MYHKIFIEVSTGLSKLKKLIINSLWKFSFRFQWLVSREDGLENGAVGCRPYATYGTLGMEEAEPTAWLIPKTPVVKDLKCVFSRTRRPLIFDPHVKW